MGYAGSQFHCGPKWVDNPLAATPVLPPDPFANAGAQDIPYLRNITVLEGVGPNALSAILTGSLTLSYIVEILDPAGSGAVQMWQAQLSSIATGPGAQRANDWATTGVAWVQLS